MTEEPVAVLVVVGTVVVVVVAVDDDVVELAGLVVLVDGAVVDELPAPVVVEDEPLDVPPGEELVPAELVEEPFEAVALEAMPRVSGADLVWNARTPARPATVATATIGARFIGLVALP